MSQEKTIVFFPEAAFGPALNSVAIAQACEALGHKAVFFTDPGMGGVYEGYGFKEYKVNMSEPMAPEEMAKYWVDFINSHIPNFSKSPYEQIDTYVKECWEAIVDTSVWAEKELPAILEEVRPDAVCVDNVILFPAIKRYAKENGKPWLRIISCSENEIEDPDIPPHLSGCGENDKACFEAFRKRFHEMIAPIHQGFNSFLADCGEAPYPLGEFFEASPHMNLLLYPEAVQFKRRHALDPKQFQYLDGCVRKDEAYSVPDFAAQADKPLIYISFGSLGSGDTATLQRLIDAIAKLPYRALVNVGDYKESFSGLPGNVHLESWFPQPSVIPQVDAVIHHGGNNTFTECLYFGKPAIVMPFVWDGHDNATRVAETGHGFKMLRADWTDEELARNLETMLTSETMRAKLAATSAQMQSRHGPTKAAKLIDTLVRADG